MVLTGTLVNGVTIIIGSLMGFLFHRIPERMKTTIMQALALAVVLLGIQMGLQTEQFLIVVGSLVTGAWAGERLRIEDGLESVGQWVEKRMGSSGTENTVAKGFVTATLVYVVGAMAVLGAMDSGLRQEHDVLFTKSMLDGFSALIFTTTMGIGVLFSFIPVVIYQGSIALFAVQINRVVPQEAMDTFITEMTATGGVMIIAIGLKLAGLLEIRVANLLPAIPMVAFFVFIIRLFGG